MTLSHPTDMGAININGKKNNIMRFGIASDGQEHRKCTTIVDSALREEGRRQSKCGVGVARTLQLQQLLLLRPL